MRCRGRKTHPDFQQIAESCLVWRHLHFLGSLWRRTDRSVCEQRPHSLVLLILQTLLCDTITAQERKFYRASKLPFQEPSWGRLVRNNGIVENGSNYHRVIIYYPCMLLLMWDSTLGHQTWNRCRELEVGKRLHYNIFYKSTWHVWLYSSVGFNGGEGLPLADNGAVSDAHVSLPSADTKGQLAVKAAWYQPSYHL